MILNVFFPLHPIAFSSVPLDQELSKSHESVFREPGDMAMLTIGLKVSGSFIFVVYSAICGLMGRTILNSIR